MNNGCINKKSHGVSVILRKTEALGLRDVVDKMVPRKAKGNREMSDLEQFKIKDEERTKCEVWTRVMGYHRPISSFNIGKKGEVAERKYFKGPTKGDCDN